MLSAREIASQGSVNANNASRTSRYRPEIDGLRAFAVVAVIINHFNKDILPGGYLGVDIFFVISGYVITSSLFGRPSKDFKDFISGFYERRIKRLVPALSVFVLLTSITICLFNPSPGTTLKTGLTSLFGLSNLYLLKNSTDYFAQATELNIFTHTWSLGVEEQFYILFPFLIWLSGFGRQTKNGARNLFLIVGALTIASLIGFLYLYPTNQPAAYFLMPSRFWEMAAGCLIFIGFQKRASIEQFLEKVPPLLVLALIVGVMYLPMSMAATSTIAVVALSSILIASLKKQTAAFNIFTHPRVVYIGLISYSLYLWHWGVLSISRWTIGIHWWSVPFQVALMLGLAVASYRWVETPLRKGNWFGNRWKTLVVGGGVLVTLSGGLVIAKPSSSKLFTGLSYSKLPTETNQSVKTFADNLSKRKFSVAGNSHSTHLIPMIEDIFGNKSFHLRRAFPCETWTEHSDPESFRKDCSFSSSLENLLEGLDGGDYLIISSRHRKLFVGGFYNNRLEFNANKLSQTDVRNYEKEFWDQIEDVSAAAQKRSIKVVFVMPLPEFNTDTNYAICSPQWFNKFALAQRVKQCFPEASKTDLDNRFSIYSYKRLENILSEYGNFAQVNFMPEFCDSDSCRPTHLLTNNYLFMDPNHLLDRRSVDLRDSMVNQLYNRFGSSKDFDVNFSI